MTQQGSDSLSPPCNLQSQITSENNQNKDQMNLKCTGVLEAKNANVVLEILLTKNTSSRLP